MDPKAVYDATRMRYTEKMSKEERAEFTVALNHHSKGTSTTRRMRAKKEEVIGKMPQTQG